MFSKKYLICIPREHKSFWQLSQLDDFIKNTVSNLFVHERLKIPEAYSEPSQTSKIELFAKIINGSKPSKIFSAKNSNLSYWVLNLSLPASQELSTYFKGKKFCRKKIVRIKQWMFANIWWDYTKQTIAFTKNKCFYNLLK